MPRRSSKKRPRDANELAKFVVDALTSDEEEPAEDVPKKNQAAVELGWLGGKKGGKIRASRLTPEERSEAARKAAQARWANRT